MVHVELLNKKCGESGGRLPGPRIPIRLDLTRRCRPEELEVLDDQVHLLDAVTLDVADPRGHPSLDVDLPALAARSPRPGTLPIPLQRPGGGGALDPQIRRPHDLPADAHDPDPVPWHWRTGGPFKLAGDNQWDIFVAWPGRG